MLLTVDQKQQKRVQVCRTILAKLQREKNTGNGIKDIWYKVKKAKACAIGVLKGKEIGNRVEALFEEIVAKNFPKLLKVTALEMLSHKFKKLSKPQTE